jgi:6-phosphofructokinase 1
MTKLGIIVGGGPAPGINSVIAAAGLEALRRDLVPVGLYDGFSHLVADYFDPDQHTVALKPETLGRIHFEGGSIVRTARATLLDPKRLGPSQAVRPDKAKVTRVLERLLALGITKLLTIGGDDTALSARFLADASDNSLRVVHVPKTIDNDLPLPGDVPTFGFATARHVGAEIVSNLMKDAETSPRWYIVVTMGRNAGFLALGIGKAVGATVTLIPEEFADTTTIEQVADILETAILKRRALGRPDGVAILAEGLAYRLGDRSELAQLIGRDVPVDTAGHPRLSHVPLAQLVVDELTNRFAARDDSMPIIGHTLGWELRSARPQTSDLAYTRDLGHGGVRLLCEPPPDLPNGAMVSIQAGNLVAIPFGDMVDPTTDRTRIRTVDLQSYTYTVARAYMIRLEPTDADSPELLATMAREAGMTVQQFRERFAYLMDLDPSATNR